MSPCKSLSANWRDGFLQGLFCWVALRTLKEEDAGFPFQKDTGCAFSGGGNQEKEAGMLRLILAVSYLLAFGIGMVLLLIHMQEVNQLHVAVQIAGVFLLFIATALAAVAMHHVFERLGLVNDSDDSPPTFYGGSGGAW